MSNLWPSNLEPSSQESPASIISEQNRYIADHTSGHITLNVRKSEQKNNLLALLNGQFHYKVDIVAPFLSGYSYNIFEFSHPPLLYPVNITPALDIRNELGVPDLVTASNENEVREILREILSTEAVKSVVQKVWGLSKGKQ